ncbi:D-alanyl-D-alanine carboxypeptidase family protein [Anaerobacillus sp. MEB173]|uniref:M15 family metallopeptidase n=1 Tax=Anaerobacillus sp. MEB173 TaxID=3383345 RepID=UPI003F91DEAC
MCIGRKTLVILLIGILCIMITGCNKETKEENLLKDVEKLDGINTEYEEIQPSIEGTTKVDPEGRQIVTNLSDILILVNKDRQLPYDYEPEDLIEPEVPFSFEGNISKRLMREEAAHALEELFLEADKEDVEIFAVSGYRSYERQEAVFAYYVNQKGEHEARKVSAYPGQSEHQTGLAMDITSRSVNLKITEEFGETSEGMWLMENAHNFGFIIRYPKDKTEITGYSYEPWHIRYVGKTAALEIFERKITLEEYFLQ